MLIYQERKSQNRSTMPKGIIIPRRTMVQYWFLVDLSCQKLLSVLTPAGIENHAVRRLRSKLFPLLYVSAYEIFQKLLQPVN